MITARSALGVASVLIACASLGACADDDGLPDLDAVTEADFPVGAEVQLESGGCDRRRADVSARQMVSLVAAADDVSARSLDDQLATGTMLEGERVVWRVTEPGEVEVSCDGPMGSSQLTIVVEPPAAPG